MSLYTDVKTHVKSNAGKISVDFINEQVSAGTTTFAQLSPNMRVCLIRLKSGHEVLGVAQVLDASNDNEIIGNEVAYTNAKEQLWKVFGAIALS